MTPAAGERTAGAGSTTVVNGQTVTTGSGASILDAARAAGVAIPTLCYHPALPVDGSCRLCLVEIEGRPGLHPACVEPAADDLRVRTDTPATQAARRTALALLLGRYRPRPATRDNELLVLARAHGLSADGATGPPRRNVDESDPYHRLIEAETDARSFATVEHTDGGHPVPTARTDTTELGLSLWTAPQPPIGPAQSGWRDSNGWAAFGLTFTWGGPPRRPSAAPVVR